GGEDAGDAITGGDIQFAPAVELQRHRHVQVVLNFDDLDLVAVVELPEVPPALAPGDLAFERGVALRALDVLPRPGREHAVGVLAWVDDERTQAYELDPRRYLHVVA